MLLAGRNVGKGLLNAVVEAEVQLLSLLIQASLLNTLDYNIYVLGKTVSASRKPSTEIKHNFATNNTTTFRKALSKILGGVVAGKMLGSGSKWAISCCLLSCSASIQGFMLTDKTAAKALLIALLISPNKSNPQNPAKIWGQRGARAICFTCSRVFTETFWSALTLVSMVWEFP